MVNMKPRSVFGAHYLVGDGYGSTLGLNNSTQFPLTVYPTLYSADGVRMPMAAVTVEPHSHIQVNMADWVSQLGNKFRTGSLQLDYHSFLNAIGAQVLVTDEGRSLSLDVPVRGRHEYRSSRLEAVWWGVDKQAEMTLIVTNTTDSAIRASLAVTSGDGKVLKSQPLPLGPHDSRSVNLRSIIARQQGSLGGISIEHEGRPGAIMAEGFLTDAAKGFSSNMRFHDPATFGGNALHGAGIYLPEEATPFEGHLMLRNISDEPLTARPLLRNGEEEINLGELTIEPGASKKVRVVRGMNEAEGQGIAIEIPYTGSPGSLIGHWISMDETGDMVVETPLRNPGPSTAGSGSHPFKLVDDFESVLFVKNTGTEPSSFVGVIFYRDEKYMIGAVELDPGKSASFDLRRLRDEQVPDVFGKLLPLDLEGGQFQWLHRTGPKMVGRMRILSRSKRISTNMSCGWCLCGPVDVTFEQVPASVDALVGDSAQQTVYRTDWSCTGQPNRYLETGGMSWDSTNPFVATPNSTGRVTCWSPGSTWILAGKWVIVEYQEIGECESGPCEDVCLTDEFFSDSAALYDVFPPPPPPPPSSVTVSLSPSAVSPQGQATVTVTIQPAAAGRTVNLTVAETQFSGGHQHSGRPLGSFGATSGTTNANGTFQTTYTASAFGGGEVIRGTVSGVNGDATLTVAVSGLVALGAHSSYRLVGTTTSHPSNHYGTLEANSRLIWISDTYAATYPGGVLDYNDQSLVQGGLFDVGPPKGVLWMSPHVEHRLGRNCDVPKSPVPQARWSVLEDIFLDNALNFLDEVNHWHLRLH